MEGTLPLTWLFLNDNTWSQSTNKLCTTTALSISSAQKARHKLKLLTLVAVQSKLLITMINQAILTRALTTAPLTCQTTQMLTYPNKLRTLFPNSSLYSQTLAIFHLSIGINGTLPLIFQFFLVIDNTVFWRFEFVQQQKITQLIRSIFGPLSRKLGRFINTFAFIGLKFNTF